MNVPLLKKVGQAIMAEPRWFDMTWWIDTTSDKAPCGTTACIGGFAILLSKIKGRLTEKTWATTANKIPQKSYMPRYTATVLLDLDKDQAFRLFDINHWPYKFTVAYQAADRPERRAKAAADRIEFFIQTNGTDVG